MPRDRQRRSQIVRQAAHGVEAFSSRERAALRFAFAPHVSSLPTLHPEIPYSKTIGSKETSFQFAEALVRLGALQDQDWDGSIDGAVTSALKRWLPRTKHTEMGVFLSTAFEESLLHDSPFPIDDKMPPSAIGIYTRNASFICLEACFSDLEEMWPGLAQRAYCAVLLALVKTTTVIWPATIWDYVEMWWWHGCPDESEAVAQGDEEVITKAQMEECYPKTARRPSRRVCNFQRPPRGVLRRKFHGVRIDDFVEMVRDLEKWNGRLPRGTNHLRYLDYCPNCSAPYILRWNENDETIRVLDTAFEYDQQTGGLLDACYMRIFPQGDVAEVVRAFGLIHKCYSTLAKVEPIIEVLGTPENRSRSF